MTYAQKSPILVVAHTLRGDFNNALAVALAVARGAEVRVLDVRLRTNVLLPLLRWALNRPLWLRTLWPFLFKGPCPQIGTARAVVATLGRGETVGAAVSVLLGVPAIQIGTPKRVPVHHFAAVIAHQGQQMKAGEIVLPLPPTRVTPKEVRTAALTLRISGPQDFALLMIGGPTRTIVYGTSFWSGLYALIKALPVQTGQRWLITTSQRTPPHVVQNVIRMAQESKNIAEIDVFKGEGPSRLLPYLGLARIAFVTGESLSMIADALGADLPVAALTGHETRCDAKITGLLDRWEKLSFVHQILLEGYAGRSLNLPQEVGARSYWADMLWVELKKRSLDL